ncbi:MAG: folate transporter [Firmicutes bacterium]|nr:folate transporter [Bacillota bacterium]
MHLLKSRHPYQPVINTNTLIVSAIFVALIIIFTHVIAIQTPFVRVSFSFLPIALFAMLYGPLPGGTVAAIADILGCLLFSPGLYFPGFTLSAFITGMIYGYFLHNKKITLLNLSLASIVILLLVDLALNTVWLSLLYHKAASAFLFGRLIKCLVLLPVQIAAIYAICKPLLRYRIARPQ